jgi:hypothetical protein
VRAVPRLSELYPGIFLTTEEKARKILSHCSRRMSVGTMKTEYTEQNICDNKNKHHSKNTLITQLNKSIQNIQPHTQ